MAGLFTAGKEGKKIFYKTNEEVALIREACMLVSRTHGLVASLLKPGVTGKALDKAAEEFIRDHGGRPAFKGYRGFPATLCISKNDVVVHGFPSDKEYTDDDVVSIDCGVELNGFFGDSAFTYALPNVPAPVLELMAVTYGSLYKGIEQAVVGKRIGDIAYAIQDFCERKHRYGVVRELVGHGLGRSLHEEPDVPNYGKRGQGLVLRDGLVLAIEPMVNLGVKEVYQANDGWTIHTRDRKPSAHYEHTVVVRREKAEVLSTHDFIHEAIKNNAALQKISPKS